MEEVTVILKGGPCGGEQVKVKRGYPCIEVAEPERLSDNIVNERNCTATTAQEFKRLIYLLSKNSDLEYVFSEPKK